MTEEICLELVKRQKWCDYELARGRIKTHKNVKSLLNIVYCTLFLREVGCSNVWKNDKLSLVKLAKYHFEGWQFDKVQPIGVDFVHLWWWYFGFSPSRYFSSYLPNLGFPGRETDQYVTQCGHQRSRKTQVFRVDESYTFPPQIVNYWFVQAVQVW